MRLESIGLKNFKAFRDVEFNNLPDFCVLVGANGTGKSTFFEVFQFLKDILTYDLSIAFQRIGGNRGFDDVRSRGSDDPIVIALHFRTEDDAMSPLVHYSLTIGKKDGRPVILTEMFIGSSVLAWSAHEGEGTVTVTETDPELPLLNPPASEETLSLKSPDTLALRVLMLQKKYPAAVKLGEFISNWHISDFNIQRDRLERDAEVGEHLSREGNNLASVAEHLYTKHPDVFRSILERLKIWVPGVNNIESRVDEGGRVLLRIQDGAFKDPFAPQNTSDGTLGAFAYLVLLHDPKPHSLLCIEEPEKQLYPTILEDLGEELRAYARRGGQVMASTHSPDFLNACRLDEVFWLEKKDGYTQVFRAADDPQIAAYMKDGEDKMGNLWTEGWFGKANPI